MKKFIGMIVGMFLLGISGQAQAYWEVTWPDNSDNEVNFAIERKEGNGAYAEIGQVAANVTLYADTTSLANIAYCYRIKAINQYGDNTGPEGCGLAAAPTAPGLPQLIWRP